MKKSTIISFGVLLSALLACSGDNTGSGDAVYRSVQVELSRNTASTNAAGDLAWSFLDCETLAYTSDAGDNGTASVSVEGGGVLSLQLSLNEKGSRLWCYTPGLYGEGQSFSVPERITKTGDNPAMVNGMAFCSTTMSYSGKNLVSGNIKPQTSAVILEIVDSRGTLSASAISSVEMVSSDGSFLAGSISMNLQEGSIAEVKNGSPKLIFDCTDLKVGTTESPLEIGAAVLPCTFTGTITVTGGSFSSTVEISSPLTLQAGYVKRIRVDVGRTGGAPSFPRRLGIMGDSISTFEGKIPSGHRTYYPAGDVDDWTKTYWGQLITEYWKCELDVNTSWSGSSVADGKAGTVRTPFVERCGLFNDPDAIILFGGTNDAIADNQIGLGEFSYDTPLSSMNTTRRFRDAYIFVIRTLMEKYPKAQIICIIGTHVTGDYGTSVEQIARHYNLPCVDFRGDTEVTIYSGSHPNAAGHAHKARRIYEETLSIF